MSVTNAQAQRTYLAAVEALEAIARSRKASADQKQTARRELDRMDLDFIDQNIADVNARTAKFQEFIANMERVIARMESDGLMRGMKGLTEALIAAQALVDD